MKKNLLLLATVLLGCGMLACSKGEEAAPETVHLQGQLVGIGTDNIRMSYNGAASMVGDSRDLWLKIDDQGRFDTTFVLTEPAYYNISRNTLYLTPGDDLTVRITSNNDEAQFSGRGAAANNYMKYRLFPKAGSFLAGGEQIGEDFPSTKSLVQKLAGERRHQLDTLTGVSDRFKKLEGARITADIINSYTSYPAYSNMMESAKDRDEMIQRLEAHMKSLTPDVAPLFKEIAEDPELLDVAVVRDVLYYRKDTLLAPLWLGNVTFPERTRELYQSAKVVSDLRSNGVSQEVVDSTNLFIRSLKNKDFADELRAKVSQASLLLPGQPAIDFKLTDTEGNPHMLSDFRGKVLYIDLWATWCGPCLNESPHFEALAKKYEGKDITFIPISTDTTVKPWLEFLKDHKKDLTQYHSDDMVLKEKWAIMYIPRFILIDKDFNIVNAYAPRPSSEEISPLLDSLLK